MNFLSLLFAAFFAAVLVLYYVLPKKLQNYILLAANLTFYLRQSPRLGIYIAVCSLAAWLCTLGMNRLKARKLLLLLPMLCCFGLLCFFKYFDFALTALFGRERIGLVLPAGISFYSFALVGYVFDVYRRKIEPERNFVRFAVFASFFPSVLSGPINRAGDIFPQLLKPRCFEAEGFKKGFLRFIRGAAKKLITASLLGKLTDTVYAAPADFSSASWIIAVIAYSLQIYIDFSAYSDMAIGAARMLGIELNENFLAPYLSRDVKSFWKKWHISLTSWFRDYLYIPLGGSRKGKWRTRFNILIVFAVSGIWHGAGLTYLIWGLMNGLFQVVGSITQPVRKKLISLLHIPEGSRGYALWQGLFTFGLMTAAWIFFRADTMHEAVFIIKRILLIFRDGPGNIGIVLGKREAVVLAVGIAAAVIEDILIAKKKHLCLEKTTWAYWIICAVLLIAMMLFGFYGENFNAGDFVYFKF